MSLKIEKSSSCEAQVTTSRAQNELQAARAIDEHEEDALFEAGEFGDSNPVALQRTMWWFLSLHLGFQARDESEEGNCLNAASFKVENGFHSNLFLIRTL